MSALRTRVLGAAVLLTVLACGGEDDSRDAGAEPGAEAALAESGAASAGETTAAGERGADQFLAETTAAPAPESEVEARIGAVLDTDAEGEGLDLLIRSAREDADPSVREAAVIALGDSEDARALDALIAATEDADSRVVLAAIDQLGWFDDRRAEDAIRRLVDSSDPEIADAAREGLEE